VKGRKSTNTHKNGAFHIEKKQRKCFNIKETVLEGFEERGKQFGDYHQAIIMRLDSIAKPAAEGSNAS